jgi:hypothetical protein
MAIHPALHFLVYTPMALEFTEALNPELTRCQEFASTEAGSRQTNGKLTRSSRKGSQPALERSLKTGPPSRACIGSLYNAISRIPKIRAICYTQLYDVEQE